VSGVRARVKSCFFVLFLLSHLCAKIKLRVRLLRTELVLESRLLWLRFTVRGMVRV